MEAETVGVCSETEAGEDGRSVRTDQVGVEKPWKLRRWVRGRIKRGRRAAFIVVAASDRC